MDSFVQNVVPRELQELLDLETRLEAQAREMETRLSGLKDIDLLLTLARVKLQLCLALMRAGPGRGATDRGEDPAVEIGEKASTALRLVDGLLSENISEDQAGIVQATPLFAEFREVARRVPRRRRRGLRRDPRHRREKEAGSSPGPWSPP